MILISNKQRVVFGLNREGIYGVLASRFGHFAAPLSLVKIINLKLCQIRKFHLLHLEKKK